MEEAVTYSSNERGEFFLNSTKIDLNYLKTLKYFLINTLEEDKPTPIKAQNINNLQFITVALKESPYKFKIENGMITKTKRNDKQNISN